MNQAQGKIMALDRILIIDDSDADLHFTELTLQASGIAKSVLSFGIASEALVYLRQPQVLEAAIILLDINMPEMNGFEFLDAYERLCATSCVRTPVVMLSSSPDRSEQTRAASYQCVKHFLIKPFDVAAARGLLAMVDRPVS